MGFTYKIVSKFAKIGTTTTTKSPFCQWVPRNYAKILVCKFVLYSSMYWLQFLAVTFKLVLERKTWMRATRIFQLHKTLKGFYKLLLCGRQLAAKLSLETLSIRRQYSF